MSDFVESLEMVRPPAADLSAFPDILTPQDLLAWMRFEPESRWVEKNIKRIPGRFKAGRFWRFRKADIEFHIVKTGQVLLRPGRRGH